MFEKKNYIWITFALNYFYNHSNLRNGCPGDNIDGLLENVWNSTVASTGIYEKKNLFNFSWFKIGFFMFKINHLLGQCLWRRDFSTLKSCRRLSSWTLNKSIINLLLSKPSNRFSSDGTPSTQMTSSFHIRK